MMNVLIFIVDNCPAEYCLSGGICRMNGNTAYCDCPASHTGPRCETSVSGTTASPGLITVLFYK